MRNSVDGLQSSRRLRLPVVVPACSNQYFVARYFVYETMFFRDSARPISREVVAQRLGFPNSFITISSDISDEEVDPFEDPSVLTLPP